MVVAMASALCSGCVIRGPGRGSAAAAEAPGGAGENLRLSRGFAPDPSSVRGTAGGARDGAQLSEQCRGWIADKPDHELVLVDDFPYLRLDVQSTEDTMLIMRGPGGVRCDDDSGGAHQPRIEGRFNAGRYALWVGSFQPGEYTRYELRITETRRRSIAHRVVNAPEAVEAPPPVAAEPFKSRYGRLVYDTHGAEPLHAGGRSGGEVDAWQIDPACSGWIAAGQPDHVLVLSGPVKGLGIEVKARQTVTLVVRGPSALHCSAPGEARIQADLPAGSYSIWVGTVSQGASADYELAVTGTSP